MVPPLKVLSTKKLIWARLGVSRTIYVNVDSPNLGFTYFNFLGGYQFKKTPCIILNDCFQMVGLNHLSIENQMDLRPKPCYKTLECII